MSRPGDVDADEQTVAQFHQYVDLPSELKIKVIQEFIASLRKPLPSPFARLPLDKFAPFAVVHSEWQHEFEAEQELFGSLCLSTDDLPTFQLMLNQHRRNSLSKVTLRVYINNTVVEYNKQTDHDSENTTVVSRVGDFIVNSVATVLESVEKAISTGPQAIRARLEVHTQIMMPSYTDHSRLRNALSPANGIDCDFSQLPLTHSTRKFSQRWIKHSEVPGLGHVMTLLLSPSSLLTLASRMPNLEEAEAMVSSSASFDVTNAQQVNSCPQLKSLKILPSAAHHRIPWYTLSRWAPYWGDKIEKLEVTTTNAPSSLRVLVKREEHAQATLWPNLQVLTLRSYNDDTRFPFTANHMPASEGPIDTLRAVADAVPCFPGIRDIKIELGTKTGPALGDFFKFRIKLRSCSGSGKLTIPHPSRYWERVHLPHVACSDWIESCELEFQNQMQNAAAEVQAAVRAYRGHDLEIVWRQTLEEPQSQ